MRCGFSPARASVNTNKCRPLCVSLVVGYAKETRRGCRWTLGVGGGWQGCIRCAVGGSLVVIIWRRYISTRPSPAPYITSSSFNSIGHDDDNTFHYPPSCSSPLTQSHSWQPGLLWGLQWARGGLQWGWCINRLLLSVYTTVAYSTLLQ